MITLHRHAAANLKAPLLHPVPLQDNLRHIFPIPCCKLVCFHPAAMSKKENPLRQLPVSSDGYGDIKIHLAEILEEKNISLNRIYPARRNTDSAIKPTL